MFISYIIPPYQSESYLVRCIASLYSQTSDDFEVIVAEYNFINSKDYIKEALEKRTNFKVIEECREEEKLSAAVRLIDESAEFVQFMDAGTVAMPHALETLRSAAGEAELLIPATVLKTSDGFVKRFQQGWEEAGETGGLNAFDYCFRKTLFDRYAENIIADLSHVETLLDILLCTGTPLVFVEAICYYITKSEFGNPYIAVNDYDKLQVISANIAKEELGSVKVKLFTKYVHRLTAVIDSDRIEYAEKLRAYETLRMFGEDAAGSFVLSKIFTLNTGIPAADMKTIDLSGYRTLRNEIFRLSDTESSVSTITAIMDDANLRHIEDVRRIEAGVNQLDKKYDKDGAETEKMREDIAAMAANLHCLLQRIEEGGIGAGASGVSSFGNPVTEVPYLFATGKLGFKVILKSIRGWFRYKFSRK